MKKTKTTNAKQTV